MPASEANDKYQRGGNVETLVMVVLMLIVNLSVLFGWKALRKPREYAKGAGWFALAVVLIVTQVYVHETELVSRFIG